MSIVAIIPARGGSQRIHLKNIRHFHGRPIIEYSIDAAIKSEIFTDIIVSTDSQEIKDVVESYSHIDVHVHHRSDEMSKDEIGTQTVVKNVLQELPLKYDLVCCIYATVPMIDHYELVRAQGYLRFNETINYVVPVANWLEDPGRWYFGRYSAFINDIPLISDGTRLMKVDASRAIDINTEDDWGKAVQMYQSLHEGGQ